MDPRTVIIEPVISEKSYALMGANKYTFRVHEDAHKTQIKQALLDYAGTEEGQATLESIYEITGLVEADQEAFAIVEEAAEQLGVTSD